MNPQIKSVIKNVSFLALIFLNLSCNSLKVNNRNELVVKIDTNQLNQISYRISEKGTYFITITFDKDNKLILREPIKEDISLEKERFIVEKDRLLRSYTVMEEEEFVEFAGKGLPWNGECKECEWGNFKKIFIAFKLPDSEDYQLYRLASTMIDI